MRITESQLRKIVRQEILREADLRGATFVQDASGKWVPAGGSDWEGPGAMAASRSRAGRPSVGGDPMVDLILSPEEIEEMFIQLTERELGGVPTLAELADALQVDESTLKAALQHHPGLRYSPANGKVVDRI